VYTFARPMLPKLSNVQRLLIAVVAAVVLILILSIGLKKNGDTHAVLPADIVVDRALAVANAQGPDGGAVAPPTEARGQTMSYGQAVQFVLGRPLAAAEAVTRTAAYPVWLVVLQGQFVEHVPAAADGSAPAKDVLHSQMAIILDGDTTESLRRIMIAPAQPLDVSSLPLLTLPSGTPEPTTTPYVNPALIPTPTP
jgi:hypothetical protein